MPGPTEYVIWTEVGGSNLVTLYSAGNSLTAQETQDFLTNARNACGWTSGLTYFKDVSGTCYSTLGGTDPSVPAGGAVAAQYGSAGTSSAICSPPTDDIYYGWRVIPEGEPCTYSVQTTAYTNTPSGQTVNAERQGTYDFWQAMGAPGPNEIIQWDGKCWIMENQDPIAPNGGVVYNEPLPSSPPPNLGDAAANCDVCTNNLFENITYHMWEICNSGAEIPLLYQAPGTTIPTDGYPSDNDNVYLLFNSPSIGDVTSYDDGSGLTCYEYRGQSTIAIQTAGFGTLSTLSNTATDYGDCTSCQNPSTTDQYYHNWKRHNTCGTSPITYSITTASNSGSLSVQRQGSHDFWVAMGEPTVGQFVTYAMPGSDPQCWEYMGYDPVGEMAPGSMIEYNATAPTPALTAADHFGDCTACYTDLTSGTLYHLFSMCTDPSTTFIGLGNVNGSTVVTTVDNNAIYTALQNPSPGQYFEFGFANVCMKYEGQGTAAQATGTPISMNNVTGPINPGTFYNDCATCETPPGDYHKWMKCGSTEVANMVALGQTNTPANNLAFWTAANSPNPGDIVNFDTSKNPVDNCYEYIGTDSTASSGLEFKDIATTQTYQNCAECLNPPVYGCTNPLASNYDPTATVDDGSCITATGCTNPNACNYDPLATVDDGSCLTVWGCMDPSASNYDANATCDDGTCIQLYQTGGCTIAFGQEECQPDGTSSVDIDLSAGEGLINVTTTVNGAPYGSPIGCIPPANIPVTGLTEGQLIRVTGECSYTREDYDASNNTTAPAWALSECGQSTQVISNSTKVYVYYDGTSMGVPAAKNAYKSVMKWLIDLPDFTVDTVHGSSTQNVFHTAVAGERWLDWAVAPMTGRLNNNQAVEAVTFKWTGGGQNDNVTQNVTTSNCTAGSDCFKKRNDTTNLYEDCTYCAPYDSSKMLAICNWSYDTVSESQGGTTWNVDQFYDTAQGTLVGQPMNNYCSTSGCTSTGQNGNQVYVGHPPMTTDDTLVIIFADESAFSYHAIQNGTPSYASSTTQTGSNTVWGNLDTVQPTPSYRADYTEYIQKRNLFTQGGKSYKAFLYPSCPTSNNNCSCGGSHDPFPLHALAAIHSGNNTPADGMWQVGTSPANGCHSSTVGADLAAIESSNPYWTGNTPTWGGLDQHGFGVNVDEVPFNDQTFVNDLTVFLGSGGTQETCDDSQCIHIKAIDENGSPLSGYPISVNGVSIGTTNAGGVVSHTLNGPSPVIINDCYTFSAVGGCFQTQITVTISEAQYITTLNCILGCTDPSSWNYNPLAGIDDGSCMYPLEEDPRDSMSRCELLKIDTECQFATDIYNIYKHDRFGFERACLNNIEGHINKKYSSDWVDRLLPDYGAETMTKKTYTSNSLVGCDIQPCGEVEACDTGMDVAFVVDYTSSMAFAINNVKAGIADITNKIIQLAGTSDYKLSLTLFDEYGGTGSGADNPSSHPYSSKTDYTSLPAGQRSVVNQTDSNLGHPNTVDTMLHYFTNLEQFNTNNQSAFTTQLNLLNTTDLPLGNSNAHDFPEPGDIAVDMVGLQNFSGTWRSNVARYIILMTDALPGGTNNHFSAADTATLATLATNLVAQDIKVIVIGYGVQLQDPNNLGTYPWRIFAEATGGIWNAATGGDFSTATIDSLQTLCDSSEPSAAYDGSECILVVVKDKAGQLIPDYEIVLDGLYAGKTNAKGELKLNIPNAAEDTEHKINLCHCFTTTGVCGKSQKIEITVDGVDCDDCGNIKMF